MVSGSRRAQASSAGLTRAFGSPATRSPECGSHARRGAPRRSAAQWSLFVDWAVPNRGHSSSITRIAESFAFTARGDFETSWGTVERGGRNIAYRYNVSGKRLVTSADRSAVITYYDGR